jgi:soluble lytic murein transglycosylase-like protein
MFAIANELPPDIPAACVVRAAEHYKVPLAALTAMLRQEGGKVGKEYPRSHGTYYGPAQVSDKWLPAFAKWNITAEKLRDDACVNVTMGAYILAYYKAREADWPRAIARYNVGSLDTPKRREAGARYSAAVIKHWWSIHTNWEKTAYVVPAR